MNIAILCSGSGTNLQAIIDSVKSGYIPADIKIVISDKKEAYALERADRAGIKALFLDPKNFSSREDFDKEIIKYLKETDTGLVVLAGYMRLLSDHFIGQYRGRIMNVHPALLPAFKGAHAIKDALQFGAKVTGATVHFVTEDLDNGPIILQKAVCINEDDDEVMLLERVHQEEHRIYPEAIRLFAEGKLTIEGRRVVVK